MNEMNLQLLVKKVGGWGVESCKDRRPVYRANIQISHQLCPVLNEQEWTRRGTKPEEVSLPFCGFTSSVALRRIQMLFSFRMVRNFLFE